MPQKNTKTWPQRNAKNDETHVQTILQMDIKTDRHTDTHAAEQKDKLMLKIDIWMHGHMITRNYKHKDTCTYVHV